MRRSESVPCGRSSPICATSCAVAHDGANASTQERQIGHRPDHQRGHGPDPSARSLPRGRNRPPHRRCWARRCSGRWPGDEPERAGDHRMLKLARTIADPSARSGPAWQGASASSRRTSRRRFTFGRPRRMEQVDSQTTRIGTRFGRRRLGSECEGEVDGQARRGDSPPAYRSAVTSDHRWGAVSGACSAVTSFTTLCHAAAKVTGC